MDLSFLTELKLPVIPKALLRDYTTFRLGGACRAMVLCQHSDDVIRVVRALRSRPTPFVLIGFGSNILASDNGVDCIVVRFSCAQPHVQLDGETLIADAGSHYDDIVTFAIDNGLEGMTSFSGIPGTIGGAIAGNAGAYGKQISDLLESVTVLKPDNTITTLPRNALGFTYRNSDLKHNGDIILSCRIRLTPGDALAMRSERNELLTSRETRHGKWDSIPCAGSFFRNIEPTSTAGKRQAAGHFLEEAGAKQMRVGQAHVLSQHANIVTHDNGCAQDVHTLTLQMAQAVKEKFGLDLAREVRMLGSFRNGPSDVSCRFW